MGLQSESIATVDREFQQSDSDRYSMIVTYYTSILSLIWYSYLKKSFDGSFLYMFISHLIKYNGGILNVQGYNIRIFK